MAVKYSANAVLAMVRALYGKRLTREELSLLAASSSVPEVVDRLKNSSDYSEQFASVSSADLTRERVETLLTERQRQRIASISTYEKTLGMVFYRYNIVRYDIELIVHFTALLRSDSSEKQILYMPGFYLRNTNLDLTRLSEASDFSSLLLAVKGTPYHRILSDCELRYRSDGEIIPVEQALLEYSRRELLSLSVRSGFSAADKCELFKQTSDINALIMLYRMTAL
nr:V-type ATPase subunit [Clostridia bacterium]